jgi:PAS domain S-box-containing protein
VRESQRALLLSQEIARIGSYDFDVTEDRWTSSAALEAIFGIDQTYPRKGSNWLQLVHPEDRDSMGLYLADLLAHGSRFDQQYRIVERRTGETLWVHGLGELQRGPGGEPLKLVGTIQDITVRKMAEIEREALQGKLALASRLAAMGTLVAGVAHEINNPLVADVACAGLALEEARDLHRRLQDGSRADSVALLRHVNAIIEALEDATDGSQQVARIVKDLAAFANPDPKRTRVLLVDVAATAIRWMPMALGQNVDIRVEDHGAPPVLASAGQIEQVMVNLLTNAAKATPPGKPGDIVIKIGPGGDGKARLDVIDRGVGIDPKIRERIFEPFFTTRRVGLGRGAGLGLAICHAIVTDHGGTLTVDSELGKGSTFRLELPAVPADV